MLVVLSIARAAFAQDTGVPENPGHIELAEWPGEYCADIIGGSVEDGEILQAHTCSTGPSGDITPDQEFTTDTPNVGNLYITQADFCVSASRLAAGSHLVVADCASRDRRQMWTSSADGQIHPASDSSLCWAVEAKPPSAPGGHKRTLSLQACSDVNSRYTVWLIPGGSVGS